MQPAPLAFRLHFSLDFTKGERRRLLGYPKALPTFAVPFKTKKGLQASNFALQGKNKNPSRYSSSLFNAYVRDAKSFVDGVIKSTLQFFFWKYPYKSGFVFVFWQVIVTYPTESIALAPMMTLVALMGTYFRLPPRPPLEVQYSLLDMTRIALLDHTKEGVTVEAGQRTHHHNSGDASDDGASEGGSEHGDHHSDKETDDEGEEGEEEGDEGEEGEDGAGGESSKPKTKAELKEEKKKKKKGGLMSKMNMMGDGLSSLIRSKPSLAEEIERVQYEVEEEVFSQMPPEKDEQGFTLNPIARILGPVQGILHNALVYVRIVQRIGSWDDRVLTFQICIGLGLFSACLILFGELLMLIPWMVVFEWIFRLLGVAVFGPHMIWVGRHLRKQWREEEAKAKVFASASHSEPSAHWLTHGKRSGVYSRIRRGMRMYEQHLLPSLAAELRSGRHGVYSAASRRRRRPPFPAARLLSRNIRE